jgi:hypothetical protein
MEMASLLNEGSKRGY